MDLDLDELGVPVAGIAETGNQHPLHTADGPEHIDWYEVNESDIKVCIILDDASRKAKA